MPSNAFLPPSYFYPGWFASGWFGASGPASGTLRQALTAALIADAGVASIFGGRIYPQVVPETEVLAAITYQILTNPRFYDLDGSSGISNARVLIAAISKNELDNDHGVPLLRNLLDEYSGRLAGLVDVDSIFLEQEIDSVEVPADGTDRYTYRTALDFSIFYREPLPTR